MKKGKRCWLSPLQNAALRAIDKSDAEYIIGIDEVGLGCWAGPIVAAGVVLPKYWAHYDVVDSKKFNSKKKMRRVLLDVIYPTVLKRCLLSYPSSVIDTVGLLESQKRLIEGVALFLLKYYPTALVVQDGLSPVPICGSCYNVVALPEADVHVPAVSAASILAKVSRDSYMATQHELYPRYGFDTNVGYHSIKHKLALKEYGLTPLHRRSFRPVREAVSERAAIAAGQLSPMTAPTAELVDY